jgi:hypothetical protein
MSLESNRFKRTKLGFGDCSDLDFSRRFSIAANVVIAFWIVILMLSSIDGDNFLTAMSTFLRAA